MSPGDLVIFKQDFRTGRMNMITKGTMGIILQGVSLYDYYGSVWVMADGQSFPTTDDFVEFADDDESVCGNRMQVDASR